MNSSKESSDWRLKLSPLLGVATIFLVVLTAVGAVEFFNRLKENRYIGLDPSVRNEIVVAGRAERFVSPDQALITLGVRSEARTVGQAMDENSKKMNRVIDFLKNEIGLTEENLKTAQFNLSPRYEWHETTDRIGGERVLAGYEVNQMLEIKIKDFDPIGRIIQGSTELGANQVGDLRFLVEDQEKIKEEIRAEAIAEAKEKARVLAGQLGVSLVRITGFREDGPIGWDQYMADSSYLRFGEVAAPSPVAPSIEPGENKIEVNINITYEIN